MSHRRSLAGSWFQLFFALFRMLCWIALAILWFGDALSVRDLFKAVTFVTFLSLYANGATDLSAAQAAWASIQAGKARIEATEATADHKEQSEHDVLDP